MTSEESRAVDLAPSVLAIDLSVAAALGPFRRLVLRAAVAVIVRAATRPAAASPRWRRRFQRAQLERLTPREREQLRAEQLLWTTIPRR